MWPGRTTGVFVAAGPMSLHDKHRTSGELHDAIRTAPDHSLVQCRMACRPNDEQIYIEIGGKLNDVAHRMPRHDMGMQFHMPFFRHRTCPLENAMEASGGGSNFLSDLFDEFGHVIDLFDRNHVKLR